MIGMRDGVLLNDKSAVRMSQHEEAGEAERVHKSFELLTITFDAITLGMFGETAGGSCPDRLDVEHRQMPLDQGHLQITPVDAGAAGMRDA